ncbi:PKD domain-containing protein, partial [Saprospiraceae bacterium]|nr:PKD domain-containing protein [Saprospiraceae bacterium]
DPDANFNATVSAFEKYWENREIKKGSGWKPFKRWQSFMETRVDADGNKPAPDQVVKAIAKKKSSSILKMAVNDNWTELGPITSPSNGTGQPNGLGRVNAIGFHPTDGNRIYVGTPQGGLWETNDNGNTWSSNTDQLPTLGVSSILIDPNNPQIMYIGTGDRDAGNSPGLSVYKSIDAGTTWTASNTGMTNRTVGGMLFSPSNSSTIFAATNGGIYKSTDSGASWTQNQLGNFKDIRFKPGSDMIMYATSIATSAGANVIIPGIFYRSTDAGENWVPSGTAQGIPTSNRMVIGVSPANPDYVYVVATNFATFKGLYLSTDSGLTFTEQSNSPNIMDYTSDGSGTSGQAWYDLCVAVDPNNINTLYVGGVSIFKSTDGGVTWAINAFWEGNGVAASIHADQHVLEYSPINGDLYNGNDGGFYNSPDGTAWNDKSSGLAIAQVYKIGQSALTKDLVINGYQDNGTAVFDGNWRTEIGGDGMECIIDYSDDNYMYGSLFFGDIRRSSNNGVSFTRIAANGTNGITESGAFVTPYCLHETDPNTIFIGYQNIWRSDNVKTASTSAVTWSNITNETTTETVRVIEHSPVNSNILYYSRPGTLYRIDNAMATSATIINLTPFLPTTGDPTDLEAHPTDENILYMTLSNKVYQSNDKGMSWTDITGPSVLPNISINCIVYAKDTPDGLYVGTDAGIYYREQGDTDWSDFFNGLPLNSEITELEIYNNEVTPSERRIRSATYGRGLWESPLENIGSAPSVAKFTASSIIACIGSNITFTDQSTWIPTSYNWSITPNTITYINGTSATSDNPEVQFDASGLYTVALTASNAEGGSTETKVDHIEILNSNTIAPEDFESVATCGTSNDCGTTSCPLGVAWRNIPNGIEDDIDWRADNDGTGSAGTGPSVDHTLGTASGIYLYLESSSCSNRTANLVAYCVPLSNTGASELSLWYHMLGDQMGSLHIDIDNGNGWINDVVTPISGDQGDSWNNLLVNLSPYQGQTISIRIRGITGTGFDSDIAIDDIQINDPAAPVTNFSAESTSICSGGQTTFTNTSANVPTSFSWSFTPNTVTFMGGTTATSENPTVQFDSISLYTVSLTSTNSLGSSTETKTDYIEVSNGIAPLSEDFEGATFPPNNWNIVNPDASTTWDSLTVIGSDGNSTTAARVNNYNNVIGQEDEFNSIPLDLINNNITSLTFDLAYAPYSATFNDSLRVDIFIA